ncbi:MAG: DnaJ family domain-containing protein [Chloroflexota bacterium]
MESNDKEVKKGERNAGNVDDEAKKATAKKQFGPMSPQAWDDIIGQRIAQAMNDGEFDNLPGKGKRQDLSTNPYAGDNHLAFDIMQNNDITPSWIRRRKEVNTKIDKLREGMRSYRMQNSDDSEQADSTFARKIQSWKEAIAEINEEIQNVNIEQPISEMEILKLRLDEELAKAGYHN